MQGPQAFRLDPLGQVVRLRADLTGRLAADGERDAERGEQQARPTLIREHCIILATHEHPPGPSPDHDRECRRCGHPHLGIRSSGFRAGVHGRCQQ
jgi:hypothetical protein